MLVLYMYKKVYICIYINKKKNDERRARTRKYQRKYIKIYLSIYTYIYVYIYIESYILIRSTYTTNAPLNSPGAFKLLVPYNFSREEESKTHRHYESLADNIIFVVLYL